MKHYHGRGLSVVAPIVLMIAACSGSDKPGPTDARRPDSSVSDDDGGPPLDKDLVFSKVVLDPDHAGRNASLARNGSVMGVAYYRNSRTEMLVCPSSLANPDGAVEQERPVYDVYFSAFDGTEWAPPAKASSTTDSDASATDGSDVSTISSNPPGLSLAISDAGTFYLGYLGGELNTTGVLCDSSDAMIASSMDGGASWTPSTYSTSGAFGDTVGHWMSVAIDCDGNPQATHRDVGFGGFQRDDNFRANWVYGDGDFILRPDFDTSLFGEGDGHFTSLVFTADCRPASIAYNEGNPIAGVEEGIRFAVKNPSGWTISKVAAVSTLERPDLATDGKGLLAFVYYDGSDRSLRYKETSDLTTWTQPTFVNPGTSVHGTHSSLAFDSHGNPAVSYYRCASRQSANCVGTEDGLMFSYRINGTWKTWEVDTGNEAWCGTYTSVVFDENDLPVIAYSCDALDNRISEFVSGLKIARGKWQ